SLLQAWCDSTVALSSAIIPTCPALSFFFSSRRRHTRSKRDWSSDVCSSDLIRQPVSGRAIGLGVFDEVRVAEGQTVVGHAVGFQIGRASCRERVEISVVAGLVKKNKEQKVGGDSCTRKLSTHDGREQ